MKWDVIEPVSGLTVATITADNEADAKMMAGDGLKLVPQKSSISIVVTIDPVLLREQRLWLLKQDGPEADGLMRLLDEISEKMEAQGETRQLLVEDN